MASEPVTAIIFFFHGSGGTGPELKEWVEELNEEPFTLPQTKIIYPTAPIRKYTLIDGEETNVWFDRSGLSLDLAEHRPTLDEICMQMESNIKREAQARNVPLHRVLVGGFSMGAALSLHLAYRYMPQLAGAFAVSSFLCNDSIVYTSLKERQRNDVSSPPLLMLHGHEDDMVNFSWGQTTFKRLQAGGVEGQFIPLSNMEHEITRPVIDKLKPWLTTVLPPI